ncbi:MAG: AAA family ATPase [Anaerolineaceae bacterium]|jgi:hypothetical protein
MTELTEEHHDALDLLTADFPAYFAEPKRKLYIDIAAGNEQKPAEDRFKLHSAIEALEDFEEPEPLLSNRLHYPGFFNVLAADGGTGKSYFMLNQCMMIANKGLNTLYIDEENGEYLMKKRIRALSKGLGSEIPANLFYTCHAGIDIREPAHIVQLYEWISQNDIAFVVLDSLNAVMAGADENSSKDMKPPMQAVHRLASDMNVCITAIHHTNKTGSYRGSTAIKGEVDSLYLLTSRNNGKEINIRTEKNRDGAPFSLGYAVQFTDDTEGNLYSVTYIDLESSSVFTPAFSKSERYVIRFLSARSEATVSDIMSHADTCTEQAARQAIYALTEKGYVERTNEGAQGSTAIYGLTKKGKEKSCEI